MKGEVMNYLITLSLIGLLILIHELGHFLAARWMKIPIARFSIGYGPKLWGFKKGTTEYWFSLIPLGGYVLPDIEDEAELFQIPIYRRIIFTLGGPFANVILPVFLFGIINIVVKGFSLSGLFVKPFAQTLDLLCKFITTIPLIFSHPEQLSGIVGIVIQGGRFVGVDILKALNFSILLSANLAILNLLPIPVLDGGKIILYLLEKIHPKLIRLHIPLAIAGWIFIIGLLIYVTVLDIGRHLIGTFA
jgi:regulator of sigma E protease